MNSESSPPPPPSPASDPAKAGLTNETALPVREVVLFSSGVAYTLRAGAVEAGEASVALTFRTGQINDLLKSLVLLDPGGAVQPAIYPSRDPIGRTLQGFALDVSGNPSRADLLKRLRGTPVSVETTGRETLSGRVVGVEERHETAENGRRVLPIETLTLLGDAGLVAVDLNQVRALRLLDERLDRELREALAVLASGSDDQRRQVTLRFVGDARRTVRVGYVSEAPLWKMSYRLVLGDDAPDARPYLQGWALVENTSDDDWSDVQLALVSGRPISFIQDLYQPLYVPRPTVGPDIVASPFPQTHGASLLQQDDLSALGDDLDIAAPVMALAAAAGAGPPRPAPAPASATRAMRSAAAPSAAELRASGAKAGAEGRGAGELFRYDVTTPVRLPRGQAAMIPVVAGDIEGEKLSLYNPQASGPRPLNAVRLRNTSGLHLKGGPVTVFDGGAYAGDARLEDVPPGDNRLVSYAVDLSIEAERQDGQTEPGVLVAVRVRRGLLTLTRKQRTRTRYTFKSKAGKPRRVLVEHPFQADWTLVAPAAPAERTSDWYRFDVSLAPGETRTLDVIEEQPEEQVFALVDTDLDVLQFYIRNVGTVPAGEPASQALSEVIRRRAQIGEARAGLTRLKTETEAIGREQERIRNNMAELDRASALYNRYVDELDAQETRLQTLQTEATRLRDDQAAAEADLRAFLGTLTIGDDVPVQ